MTYMVLDKSLRFLYEFKALLISFKKMYKIKIISNFMGNLFIKIIFFSKLKNFWSHFEGIHKYKNKKAIRNILLLNDWQLFLVLCYIKSFKIFWKS